MRTFKKILSISLTLILLTVCFMVLYEPAKADSGTLITLPRTINESGNYVVTGIDPGWPASGGEALIIAADDVVVDGGNILIDASSSEEPMTPILITSGRSRVTLQNLNVQGGDNGLTAGGTTNVTVINSNINNNFVDGMNAQGSDNLTIVNSNLNNNRRYGVFSSDASNLTIQDSNLNNNQDGLNAWHSSTNVTIINSNVNNNIEFGLRVLSGNNFTIMDSTLKGNGDGVSVLRLSNLTITNSIIDNNERYGIDALELDNLKVQGSTVNNNGYGTWIYNSNGTITNSVFNSNENYALEWGATESYQNKLVIYANVFDQNTYTFRLYYTLPKTSPIQQQLVFYNNFVNDIAYLDPASTYLPNINSAVLNFTAEVQPGTRIYSLGSQIGGNFWAHPDGTGASQTGTDADNDGFLDEGFNIFGIGAFFDTSPYSIDYTLYLDISSGTDQTLTAGQMSTAVTVDVYDAFGAVTSGITLNLASTSATGRFYSDEAGTEELTSLVIPQGESQASFYYADTAEDTPTITVFIDDMASASTQFTISHAGLDYIEVSPSTTSVTAGSGQVFTTTAYDQYGNTWDVSDPASWSISTDAGGSWTDNTYTAEKSGAWTVTAEYDSESAIASLTVTPASLHHISISPLDAAITAGESQTYTVNSYDQYGNLIESNVAAALKVNDEEYASATVTETVSGVYTIDAEYGVKTVSTTLTVNPASVDHFVLSAPSSVGAGSAFTVTVTAQDAYGNTVTDYTGTVHFTSSDTKAVLPSDAALTSGTGTFTITLKTAGAQTLTAADGAITISKTTNVNSGVVDHFTVSAPASATAGSAFSITVTAKDAQGNTVTDFTGTVNLIVSQGTISPGVSGTFIAGVWTGQVTLSASGSTTISVSDGNSHTGASSAITVSAAPTPTPTPTSNPTSTPSPTQKPQATSTPTPTTTPAPKQSIQATTSSGTVEIPISGNITSTQISNAAITADQATGKTILSLTITGEDGTVGFSNMTIPKSAVTYGGTPIVYIDDEQAVDQGYTQDADNYYVWYTVHFSTHQVKVEFTGEAPTEPQAIPLAIWGIIVAVIAAVTVVVLAIGLLRRKHK